MEAPALVSDFAQRCRLSGDAKGRFKVKGREIDCNMLVWFHNFREYYIWNRYCFNVLQEEMKHKAIIQDSTV